MNDGTRMQVSSMNTKTLAGPACTALVLLLVPGAVFADGAEILRCRLQADTAQRLACYESIVVPQAATAVRVPIAMPPAPAADLFGLEQKATQSAVRSIESKIAGRFLGWGPNDRIVLANGQVWQISDDSRGAVVATDPKVTVRRGALGAFYLDIEGTNRSPKVRRAK